MFTLQKSFENYFRKISFFSKVQYKHPLRKPFHNEGGMQKLCNFEVLFKSMLH